MDFLVDYYVKYIAFSILDVLYISRVGIRIRRSGNNKERKQTIFGFE